MSEGFEKDEVLGVPGIARYLKVSDVTVYRWYKAGRLPGRGVLLNPGKGALVGTPVLRVLNRSLTDR